VIQDSVNRTSSVFQDLRGQPDQVFQELSELHIQELLASFTSPDGQGEPGFQVPGQSSHNHIGPVAQKIVDRHPHRVDTVLELLDDVLLIAPSIGQLDDFGCCEIPTCRDIEEVSDVIEQNLLTFFDTEVLSQHDETVGLLRPARGISDLGDVFADQTDILERFGFDDLGTNILWLRT